MKTIFTFWTIGRNLNLSFFSFIFRCIALILLFVGAAAMESHAQIPAKNLATVYVDEHVDSAPNANFDNEDVAILKAWPGALLGAGKYNGKLGFEFSTRQDANTTTYVRIGAEEGGLLDALLGGSIGNLLTGLVDGLVLGDHFFKINVYNGSTPLSLSANSKNGFTDNRLKLVRNAEGHYLLAITPEAQYDRVVIENQSDAAVGALAPIKRLHVYNAYTLDGLTDCTPSNSTYYDGSGLTLDLLKLGGTGVTNAQHAIDNDPDTYSEISVGLLGVAASMSQHIVFPTLSTPQHHFTIKIGINSSKALNAEVLGAYEIMAWNGGTKVYTQPLAAGLLNGVDVLALLASGEPATLTFGPSKAFDRIEVRVNSLVGVNAASSSVQIYDVQRYGPNCPNPNITIPGPTETPFDNASCASDLVDFENVDFASQAVDGNNETYATLHADAGTLLSSGPTSGFIEIDLGHELPANKTTYVRINYDEDVLDRLLGGSLGKLLSDLTNNLLLGNQYFEVEAKKGTSSVLKARSSNAFEGNTNGVVTLVQDKLGRYYIAITPSSAYDRIRITNHVTAVLATGKKGSLDVYNACFELGEDSCFPANFTSYRGSGLNLSLGDLSSVGVENPYRAISDNSSEYSKINLGVAGIAANVYQTIYFNQPSKPNDKVKIRLQIEPSSALSIDLLGTYKIKFFNGKSQVGTDYTLQQGLLNNIDLLALFRSGGIAELEFEPSGTFDRVEIGAESLVALNVAAEPLRVYSVKRFGDDCSETIGESPFESPTCATVLVDADNADDIQKLFDGDFDSFATLNSGAGTLLGLGNKFEGFVELAYDHDVTGGTTSYIRIDFEESILKNLVGGSLGNVASGLLEGLILGDHFFEVDVKYNGTSVEFASSKDANAGGNDAIRVVRDKQGRYYIAVTPTSDYNSVRITDKTNSSLGLLAQPNTMNVYGMCYEGSIDECLEAFATSYEFSGLNLSVNDLGAAGVADPHYAINGNTTDASKIGLGTLSVAGGVKQWIFFNTVSAADDVVNIRLKTEDGVANVGLLGDLKIKAYLGNTEVATLSWGANGIINGINVLDQISSADGVEIPFKPGVAFDRISVGIENLVSASVFPPLALYSVERCINLEAPNFVAWKSFDIEGGGASVTGGEEIEYTIHVRNTGTTDISGFIIEDKIPTNTTYVPGSGGVYDSGTNVVRFEGVAALVGQTEELSFKVKVNEDLTDVDKITNVALVKSSQTDTGIETFPPSESDPNEPDNSGKTGTDIPVEQVESVVAWKAYTIGEDDKISTTVSGGEEVTYHIFVRNTGNQNLNSISISDILPPGVTWKSGGVHNNREVTFTIPHLEVGQTSDALEFVVTVDSDLTGIEEIENVAVVMIDSNDPNGSESFPPTDNITPTEPDMNSPGTILDVEASYAVTFKKIGLSSGVNDRQAAAGDEITYTLTVKNNGNKKLENIRIADELPQYTTYVSGGTLNGNEVAFTIDELQVGESSSVELIVKVDDDLDANTIKEIANIAIATFEEAGGSNKNESAEYIMQTICDVVDATAVTITQNTEACEGSPITLNAEIDDTLFPGIDFTVTWFADAGLTEFLGEGKTLDITPEEGAKYYVLLEGDGYCFNGDAAEYEVNFLPTATASAIEVSGADDAVCEGSELTLIATSTISNPHFIWYADAALTQVLESDPTVADGSVLRILPSEDATVYVTVSGDGYCENKVGDAKEVNITLTEAPDLIINGNQIIYAATDATISWPTASSPTATDIRWYDADGNEINESDLPSSFGTPGIYNYTIVAVDGNCYSSEAIVVNVYDSEDCPPTKKRVYATSSGWGSIITGGVSNQNRATASNGKFDPTTYSTITSGVGLLGIGTTWQDLFFDQTVTAGTPVTIKLGKEYSGLAVAGAITVQGLNANGGTIGTLRPVQGGVLDLLAADNVIEYTFVPSSSSGAQEYGGVRIVVGALLGVAQNAKVYGAYYTEDGLEGCEAVIDGANSDILDVLHGVEDLGVGVASATASVVNPWRAVDNDVDSYAQIVRGVAVLNQASITPVFKNQVMPTDSLQIIMSEPTNTGLSLDLLTGFSIQRYLKGGKVGDVIDNDNQFLGLKLLTFANDKVKVTVAPHDGAYDRVKIAYGGLANVNLGDQVRVYDVSIKPTLNYGADENGHFEICAGDNLAFEKQDECTTYEVYDKDNNRLAALDNGLSFTIPNNTLIGEHTYYVQAMRYGCEVGMRTPIKLKVNAVPVVEKIELNGTERTGNTIDLAPGETLEAIATLQDNGANIETFAWQIQDSNGDWVDANVPGTQLSTTARSVTMPIPADGYINGKDVRGTSLKFRMTFGTASGCIGVSDEVILNITESVYDFTDDNLLKEAKDGMNAKAVAGKDFTYRVIVKNGGPSTINTGTLLYLQDLPSAGQTVNNVLAISQNIEQGGLDADNGFWVKALEPIMEEDTFELEITVGISATIEEDVVFNSIKIWTEDPNGNYTIPEDGIATTPEYSVERDYGFDNDAIIKNGTRDQTGEVVNAVAGTDYTYYVTVENNGPSTILKGTEIYFRDLVSNGQELKEVKYGANTIFPATDGLFAIEIEENVAAGSAIELTVTVAVAANAPQTIQNTIHIWRENPGTDINNLPEPDGTDTTDPIDVDRDYGFDNGAIIKDGTRDGTELVNAVAGKEYTYIVTVQNNGPSTILEDTEIFFQDELSAGQTIQKVVYDGKEVTANGDRFNLLAARDIGPGESFTFDVTVLVDAKAPAAIQNIIHVWANDPEMDTSNPDGTAKSPEVDVERDYGFDENDALIKVASDGENAVAIAGEQFEYTITMTNKGVSTISADTDLFFQDVLSEGQEFINLTSSNGTVTQPDASGQFVLTVKEPVAAGQSVILTLTVKVGAQTQVEQVLNTIRIWSNDPGTDPQDPDGEDTTPPYDVNRISNFGVVKTTDVSTAIAGESIDFNVVLTNKGPSTAKVGQEIVITEKPGGLLITADDIAITSGNATFDGIYDAASGVFTIVVSEEVDVNGTISLRVTGHVPAGAAGTVKNGIEVDGDDSETPEIPVEDKVTFGVVKTTDVSTAIAGESIDFNVVLTNNGPSTAKAGHEIVITEKPEGLLITGDDITVTSGNATFDGSYDAASGVFTIVVSEEVDINGTISLRVTGHVPAGAAGTVKNGIEVDGDDSETPEIPVDRNYRLRIAKEADELKVEAGQTTSFTLTITNEGPSDIEIGKVLTLRELPSTGLIITSYDVTSENGKAAGTGNSATITISDPIAMGEAVTVKVNAKVASDAPATISNGIEVWGPDRPTTEEPDDRDETPEVPVVHVSNLRITKAADQNKVVAGETTSFTLTITNEGSSILAKGAAIRLEELPSTGISITDYRILGSNATVKADATNVNKATITTNSVIEIGETITVIATAKVAENAPTTISNGIQVWAPNKPETGEPDDEDNTPEIPVDRQHTMVITKKADEERVLAGENTTFTLTITNTGPSEIGIGEVINLVERPGAGVRIIDYEVSSGNAVAIGTDNTATVTASKAIGKGEAILVTVTANIAVDAPSTVTNGISVWRPNKSTTEEPDDKDDTPEIPVVFSGPHSKDDHAETKSYIEIDIDVLANDEARRFAIDPSTVRVIKQPIGGIANVNADGTITYVSNKGFVGTDTFNYQVKDVDGNWSNEALVTVTVLENPLFFPNTFTPNGDGLNDSFVIRGLDQFADNELIILNRWGNQVYIKRNYANDWTGDHLNDGTYYYILKVRNHSGEWEVHKGHIAIIRSTR